MSEPYHVAFPPDADGAGFRHSGPASQCSEPECRFELKEPATPIYRVISPASQFHGEEMAMVRHQGKNGVTLWCSWPTRTEMYFRFDEVEKVR